MNPGFRLSVACWVALLLPTVASAGDAFDRHTTYWLQQAAQSVQPADELTLDRAARLTTLARNVSNPCIIVRTNAGNWAKALIAWGYRKGKKKPTPVLLIDRYVTYRNDGSDVTEAAGKDVILFAGFSFNFDIGQVVPEGQGADIRFTPERVIQAVGNARLYPLDGSQLPETTETADYDPNDHDGVRPRDFSGSWRVNADGRWRGTWELTVEQSGRAHGSYTSEETQSRYDITGKVTGLPHRIKLNIELANAVQTVDAYLWTTDKSALAGTLTLAGRKFGFFAIREPESE